MHLPRFTAALTGLTLLGAVAGCGDNGESTATSTQIKAGDSSCTVGKQEIRSGDTTFDIENVGSDVTEVYLYTEGEGGKFNKVVIQRENIGPGTSQEMEVSLPAGQYKIVCKPGMTGDGIPADLRVAGEEGNFAVGHRYDAEFEFEVGSSGKVGSQPDMKAAEGEEIKFDLKNDDKAKYFLRVLSPSGKEVIEIEAPAKQAGEANAVLSETGSYQIKIYRGGEKAQATTLDLMVSR